MWFERGCVGACEVAGLGGVCASAKRLPFDDAAVFLLLVGHQDGLADRGLELGVVGDSGSVGVGVVDDDDSSGSFGDSLEGVEEFSHGAGVVGSGV